MNDLQGTNLGSPHSFHYRIKTTTTLIDRLAFSFVNLKLLTLFSQRDNMTLFAYVCEKKGGSNE